MEDQNTPASGTASASAKPPISAMAIVGLVLGIIAILTSFVPIVNNFAFLLAVLGIIFAIVGIVGTAKGKKSGKGMAVAALVINILAFVIVLATQALFSAAWDKAIEGSQPVQSANTEESQAQGAASGASSAANSDFSNMPIGATATLDNGMAVTVNAVSEVQDYSGDAYSEVSVTYANNGKENRSFNMFDWKAEDAQGVQRSSTVLISSNSSADTLNSGQLVSGGSVTGVIYFEGAVTKVMYSSSILAGSPSVTWVV